MGAMPTVQQLLDTSCLSGDLKFEEVSERSPFFNEKVLQVFPLCLKVPVFSGTVMSDGPNAEVWKQV